MPKRKLEKKDRADKSPRPYARMAVCAMQMGLEWRDMRHMKYTHLMKLLYEWEDANGAEVTEYVDANGSDVRALMKL